MNSVIAAGLVSTNATLNDGDDAIFGASPTDQIKNTIATLIIKGTADEASYFAAGKFTAKPKIGSTFPDVSTDPRFLVI